MALSSHNIASNILLKTTYYCTIGCFDETPRKTEKEESERIKEVRRCAFQKLSKVKQEFDSITVLKSVPIEIKEDLTSKKDYCISPEAELLAKEIIDYCNSPDIKSKFFVIDFQAFPTESSWFGRVQRRRLQEMFRQHTSLTPIQRNFFINKLINFALLGEKKDGVYISLNVTHVLDLVLTEEYQVYMQGRRGYYTRQYLEFIGGSEGDLVPYFALPGLFVPPPLENSEKKQYLEFIGGSEGDLVPYSPLPSLFDPTPLENPKKRDPGKRRAAKLVKTNSLPLKNYERLANKIIKFSDQTQLRKSYSFFHKKRFKRFFEQHRFFSPLERNLFINKIINNWRVVEILNTILNITYGINYTEAQYLEFIGGSDGDLIPFFALDNMYKPFIQKRDLATPRG